MACRTVPRSHLRSLRTLSSFLFSPEAVSARTCAEELPITALTSGCRTFPVKNAASWTSIAYAAGALGTVLGLSELSISHAEADQKKLLESEDGVVLEPFTGVQFPKKETVTALGAEAGEYKLLGTAVRCMLGQCKFAYARAYAVAIYVAGGEEAERWTAANEGLHDEALKEKLMEARGITKRLVLVMDRDVAGHHVAKGFDRSLISRVREGQGGKKGPGKDALRRFTKYFNDLKMIKKGTKVELFWRADNTLATVINGRLAGVIDSPVLCYSVFDTYFGPKSVFAKYNNTSFVFVRNQM